MSADFSDPHWAFVAPAYGLSALVLGWAGVRAWLRLRRWERAARTSAEERA